MNTPVHLPDWKIIDGTTKREIVRDFTLKGYSASRIAAQFSHCTRNSVIGHWRRNPVADLQKIIVRSYSDRGRVLGPEPQSAPRRPKPEKPARATKPNHLTRPSVTPRNAFTAPPQTAPAPVIIEPVREGRPGVSIVEAGAFECLWILPDRTQGGLATCCGLGTIGQTSWCHEHLAIVSAGSVAVRKRDRELKSAIKAFG